MVWSDQLGGNPDAVPEASKLIPDPRASSYWDGERWLGRAYERLPYQGDVLQMTSEAWDVYLLFDRDAKWTADGPPRPAWWEDQLQGLPRERFLDASRFAARAAELAHRH